MTDTGRPSAADIHDASTVGGKRGESEHRPLTRRPAGTMTDEPAGRSDSPYTTVTPAGIVSPLLGAPNEWAPDEGLRGEVDAPRHFRRARWAPGVHPDVETHASCATCTDPGEGETQMDIIGDEKIASGQAETQWDKATARHRQGTWPREQPEPVDRAAMRQRYT